MVYFIAVIRKESNFIAMIRRESRNNEAMTKENRAIARCSSQCLIVVMKGLRLT